MPNTTRKQPANRQGLSQPMSNSGPAMTPTMTTRKDCTLPIQEKSLELRPEVDLFVVLLKDTICLSQTPLLIVSVHLCNTRTRPHRTDHVLMKTSHAAKTRSQASKPPFGGAESDASGVFFVSTDDELETALVSFLFSLLLLILSRVEDCLPIPR